MATQIPTENNNPSETTRVSALTNAHRYREALASVREELDGIAPHELAPINLDIPSAVMTVQGRLPTMMKYRDDAAKLPGFDMAAFDHLETYALAAGFAHTQSQSASAPMEPIQELMDELTKTREVLLSDVSALAKRGLVDGSRLRELQGTVGYKAVSFDVMMLATLMQDNWAALAGKTAVTPAELDRATLVADKLSLAVALRDEGPAVASAAQETRQRAFTLFVTAYDQVRRAMSYLRWAEDDVDTIAPSLYQGRGTSRKKAEPAPVAAPQVAAPTVTPTNGASLHAGNGTPAEETAQGLPGHEPFIR